MYLLCFALLATWILAAECSSEESIDFSQPVTPAEYQQYIGQGFSTNFFKSKNPAARYRTKNIQDIYERGFRNLRLRCQSDRYEGSKFTTFLEKLEEVVDECIDKKIAPIISWIHYKDEANATEEALQNYLHWWGRVAETLKDRNYYLSYNLFTELGVNGCKDVLSTCDDSLRRNKEKYYRWTSSVIDTIRNTGGKNVNRTLILTSPEKTSVGLDYIHSNASYLDTHMMVEWHEYAAGPSYEADRPRYWSGNGSDAQASRLREGVERANNFTNKTNIPTYFGAWMPRDNENGGLDEDEVVNFARFFVDLLKTAQIPWSMNVLDDYYDTRNSQWITTTQTLKTARLNMSRVLDNIVEVMQ